MQYLCKHGSMYLNIQIIGYVYHWSFNEVLHKSTGGYDWCLCRQTLETYREIWTEREQEGINWGREGGKGRGGERERERERWLTKTSMHKLYEDSITLYSRSTCRQSLTMIPCILCIILHRSMLTKFTSNWLSVNKIPQVTQRWHIQCTVQKFFPLCIVDLLHM